MVLVMAAALPLKAQSVRMIAASDTNRIILIWSHSETFSGYNIYRKSGGGSYQKLNSQPIRMVVNCSRLQEILPEGTPARAVVESLVGNNICQLPEILQRNENLAMALRGYAYLYPGIAVAVGQGYIDSSVTSGVTYTYAIRGVSSGGEESGILDSTVVTAGVVAPPQTPTGIEAIPGDASVMVRWNPVMNASGYIVERQGPGGGSFIRVNEAMTMTRCKVGPGGDTLSDTTKLCFTDYLRWSGSEPDSHLVAGHWVKGPFPGKTYRYRVRAVSLTGLKSAPGSSVTVTPYDSTPPTAPVNINVAEVGDSLSISWDKVTKDVHGHRDSVVAYRVYRYTSTEDTLGTFVGQVSHPHSDSILTVHLMDRTPGLGSPYEDRRYYYRIRSVDAFGNLSELSAPIAGIVHDKTPPQPPTSLRAEGQQEYIALRWSRSPSRDVAGYNIYRGICGDTVIGRERHVIYPLHLIGSVDRPDSLTFMDRTVPKGSPICYRYAVKAYDRSQNLSDTSRTVCAKLKEKTPPPPPIIVGLKARNGGILVQWVSPPVQDLFGFIVERATAGDTSNWVRVSPELKFPAYPVCESIPATNKWAQDSIFSFLDTTADAKITYFYRVRGADYGGNIGKPSTPIKTFTFDFKGPPTPRINSVTPHDGRLIISWGPTYNPDYLGFVVFRSTSSSGGYHQVSPIVAGNSFTDKNVRPGITYWYRVQYLDRNGNRSTPSRPFIGRLP